MSELVYQSRRRWPDTLRDPRGDTPNPSPLDLLAFQDLHSQSCQSVELIFDAFAALALRLYGWVALIPGKGVHTSSEQITKEGMSPLQDRVLKCAAQRGVGVTSYASNRGVLLAFTHELYQQALDLGIRFEMPRA
ncbi:hypothetical protein JKP88DRAFT_290310 [Tribonema minus]|uniref:Uncharacterized protein n=1 Tax=Tribonema minus TaxID=303371 RepID=A0A835YY86_9STRA|nr:hypothetical protein JKP88DRAFT_290310 [Tribonema minus]